MSLYYKCTKKMRNKKNIIQLCENYLQKHKINMSVEELFIHFKEIENTHKEFNQYLQKENLNYTLEKMRRNERLKAKRELFTKWYFLQKKRKELTKKVLIELSEMTFLSERTVQGDIFK